MGQRLNLSTKGIKKEGRNMKNKARKALTGLLKNFKLIHTYIHTYDKFMSKIREGASYYLTCPLENCEVAVD